MKNLLGLLILTICIRLQGQIVTVPFDSKEYSQLMASKTMVVLIGDSDYDEAMKSAVTKYWKLTPYEFVSKDDVSAMLSDKTKSFLMPFVVMVTYVHNPGSNFSDYSKLKSWLCVLNGGKKEEYTDSDPLTVAGFNYYGDEASYKKSFYRLDYMVKGINDALIMTKEKQFIGSYLKMIFKVPDEINLGTVEVVAKKTIVINKDNLCWKTSKPFCEEDVFPDAKYPYKYKYVSDSEFREIMKGSSEEYLCLFPAIEVNKHVLLYEPSTRKTVYYGWDVQGLKITSKDIKQLAEGKR